jgi:hypothetical protein
MTATDIPLDKIEGKDFMPFDPGIFNEEPATSDKRTEPRKQGIFQLKCKVYNSESDTFEISDALVHNYGASGLYFETTHPFQPHDPVCLLSKDPLVNSCESEFAKGVHAQIVWCKPLNTGFGPRFGVGVEYFEPIESHIKSL